MSQKLIVTDARKLIFLPQADAAVVSFPQDAVISEYGANNATPTIVVRNAKENPASWQGVSRETGFVIVNLVPEGLANQALETFDQGGRTNEALQRALDFLIANGCNDQYTTPHSFASTKLSPAGQILRDSDGNIEAGIVKRDDRDQVPVWKNGGQIYVKTDAVRLIDPEILVETYREPDGSKISLDTIPEVDNNS